MCALPEVVLDAETIGPFVMEKSFPVILGQLALLNLVIALAVGCL
jgi:hypothetical protein